jgi:two-component system, cell cycle response regulator DivK
VARILVVEDNEMNRDMLSRRLQRKGFDVIVAVDGEDGVARAAADRPDLVLMDLSLPGIDGWEATRQLKAAPETSAIPVLALTAHAMAGDREKILGAGCDGYIPKPVDPQGLAGEVARYLEQGRLKTA